MPTKFNYNWRNCPNVLEPLLDWWSGLDRNNKAFWLLFLPLCCLAVYLMFEAFA